MTGLTSRSCARCKCYNDNDVLVPQFVRSANLIVQSDLAQRIWSCQWDHAIHMLTSLSSFSMPAVLHSEWRMMKAMHTTGKLQG